MWYANSPARSARASRRSRAWAMISRSFRARETKRRIATLRQDPHLARDIGLSPELSRGPQRPRAGDAPW